MKSLSKEQLIICIMVLLFFIITIFKNEYIDKLANEHDDVIRFHVIANSNSIEDQRLKLNVRDGILAEMEKGIADQLLTGNDDTLETTRKYISENIGDINHLANEIIRENGYDYGVTSKLELAYIPEKAYGDTVFPAGDYEALNIRIGKGKGENWWCVLFPPLCLIDAQDEIYKNKLGKDDKKKLC